MRVQVHTNFCFLCVLTFLFHQCNHCHEEGHDDERGAHSDLQISEAPYVSAATGSPISMNFGDVLEQEQRYFIQELFRRYGQKDRLDFQGFQSLLLSLGLGEVKLVTVDHEDLGHDHVAHLDVLDVQEGHHFHSKASDNHSKGHGHAHGHPHLKRGSHHSQAKPGPTECSKTTTELGEHEHDHHDSDGHVHNAYDHDHTKMEGSGPKHSDGQDMHDHGHDRINQHDLSSEPHSDHDDHSDHGQNDTHQVQTATDITAITGDLSAHPEASQLSLFPTSTPTPTESQTRRPRKSVRERVNKKRNKMPSAFTPSSDIHNNNNHSGSRKEKRETQQRDIIPASPKTALHVHPGGESHQHEECLNLTELLKYYGLRPDSLISPKEFTYLCPALLYQIDSRVCIRHYHQVVEQEPLDPISLGYVWMWGFVSITIISLLSLLGVVLVPILKQSCFKFLLTFLVALAVGTLSGDALLHLLPHSQGQHDHSGHTNSSNTDMMTEFDGVWKGLTALAGIYLLFIIEHCIGMFKHYKDQTVAKKAREEAKIGRKLSDHKLNRRSDAEWLHLKPLSEDPDASTISCDNGHNETQLTEFQTPDSPTNKMPLAATDLALDRSPVKENGRKAKAHRHSHGHGHSHGGNCHSDQEMKDAGIASIAWMVIMGDGMHNFSDGLAIGAAFSANLTGGISTSVAVFCHELPHELGDFAVLLKAGMSVRQAIVYNLLSALMAYFGMIIGTAVGQYTHNVTNWIFAITAGMFLYVALVDMLPEMLHGDSEDHKRCQLGHFFLQNLGMLTGFGIMLLIAIFEDQIVFDFSF